MLDSSLPDDDEELEDPVLVEVPLVVDEAEAFSAAAFFAVGFSAVAFLAAAALAAAFAAALFAAVPLELDVPATSVVEAVVLLLESAGSCPEASCT